MSIASNSEQHRSASSGVEYLHGIEAISQRCAEQTDAYLAQALAAGSIKTHEHLGSVISFLDQASSCRWGCRGGDHAAEMLVGRCANYAMGAFKLARAGFYDEAVTLIRSVGENTNLAFLFFRDPTQLEYWRRASPSDRRRLFGPAAVRRAIEKRNDPVPVDEHRYRQLSEKAIHAMPGIGPQIYNIDRRAGSSGTFQELGICFCLAELAYPLGILALAAVRLCGLEGKIQAIDLTNAGEALSDSVSSMRAHVNAFFPGTYSNRQEASETTPRRMR